MAKQINALVSNTKTQVTFNRKNLNHEHTIEANGIFNQPS